MNAEFDENTARQALLAASRIVIKVGTRSLVDRNGRPNARGMRALARQIAACRGQGRQPAVVTSGAIGAGMEALGMRARPTRLPELQMAAAVGQGRLMARYSALFAEYGCVTGQVLLTHEDFKDRKRHLNARNTMMSMLRAGVIPIINENDAVAVDEIKFGDNDLLASLVAHLIDADALLLLTTADGLRRPAAGNRTERVRLVAAVTDEVLALARGKGGALSTGGMASKLMAAREAARAGASVVIADSRRPDVIARVFGGEDEGTLIAPSGRARGGAISGRKKWLAFFLKPQGRIAVDQGARDAIEKKGKSLLPIGVKAVEGDFEQGASIDIAGPGNCVFARGLVDFSARDIRKIMGHKTSEIANVLGACDFEEVVHRDNMALLDAEENLK